VVNGKLYQSVVLPCAGRCSGVVRWTAFSRPGDVLAECALNTCRAKEGYQMIYNQYLKGNLSLIISRADFGKRALYVCECDGKDVCSVHFKIEPLKTPVQMRPGGSLLLELDVSEPVEVLHYSSEEAGGSRVQVCTVDGRTVQCKPEYAERTSLSLELRGMKPANGGMYIVRDNKNDEDIHIYTVIVKDDCDSEAQNQPEAPRTPPVAAADEQLRSSRDCPSVPVWAWVVIVTQTFALLISVTRQWRCSRTRCLRSESESSGVYRVNSSQNEVQRNGQSNQSPERQRLSSTEDEQQHV
ncbi:hypothetical protein AMEX_G25208, partial [Astyanax mexicanus]